MAIDMYIWEIYNDLQSEQKKVILGICFKEVYILSLWMQWELPI